jgi:hypothetical protein
LGQAPARPIEAMNSIKLLQQTAAAMLILEFNRSARGRR